MIRITLLLGKKFTKITKISVWIAEIRLETGVEAAAFRFDNFKEYRKFEDSIRSRNTKMEYIIAYIFE